MAFTDKQIQALRPKKHRYELPEPGRTGLAIRVSPHGVKSWAFRYRFHGKQIRIVFGTYPALSLADVRLKLAEAQLLLSQGTDPAALLTDARRALRAAPAVEDMIQQYLRHAERTMRPATTREDRRMLEKEVLPLWRGQLAKDITRKDIMGLLNGIEDRGVYVQRNRVAGVLSRLFLFGLDEGMIDASPAIKLRRLKKVGQRKVEQARSNFLSKEQIHSFWKNINSIPVSPPMKAALKWLLLTGQRRSEVAGTLRSEIDEGLWTIPGSRTKNQRGQLLPLPALALQVLAEADTARIRPQPTRMNRKDRPAYDPTPSRWLFPSVHHDKPVSSQAVTYAVIRNRAKLGIGDATVHDFRRSVATWMAEIGIEKDLISSILNHAPKGVTDQHYNQATQLGSKSKAMDRWGAWLERVIAGEQVSENVIPISRKRR